MKLFCQLRHLFKLQIESFVLFQDFFLHPYILLKNISLSLVSLCNWIHAGWAIQEHTHTYIHKQNLTNKNVRCKLNIHPVRGEILILITTTYWMNFVNNLVVCVVPCVSQVKVWNVLFVITCDEMHTCPSLKVYAWNLCQHSVWREQNLPSGFGDRWVTW